MRYAAYSKMLVASLGNRPADLVLKNGKVLNVFTGELMQCDIAVCEDTIVGLGAYSGEKEIDMTGKTIVPGFIDGHLHIESSMLTPGSFISVAAAHGTTTYIADPHEIANVLGPAGISYLLDETEGLPANVYFMIPSCVPATGFESNGFTLSAKEMKRFADHPRVLGLGEVMDYVSVIGGGQEMFEKLEIFRSKMIDGHAPDITGKQLQAYRTAGVRSDHECADFSEALEKLRAGMWIHVREGSAAKNLDTLVSGLVETGTATDRCMMCTDDKSSEEIEAMGHISYNVKRAIQLGLSPWKAVSMATINAATCYNLKHLGAIAPGYQADFVILNDLDSVDVHSVYHKGRMISEHKQTVAVPPSSHRADVRDTVHIPELTKNSLRIRPKSSLCPVIRLLPRQIITKKQMSEVPLVDGEFIADSKFNKIAVIERHHSRGFVGLGIIEGFGIKGGAIASTVAHDSHNLLAVGDNDEDMLLACEELKRCGGGYTVVVNGKVAGTLALPIAGLMSDEAPHKVQEKVKSMIGIARNLGVSEEFDPFITLSFMALPVLPELRVTDQGLFDVTAFEFVDWL